MTFCSFIPGKFNSSTIRREPKSRVEELPWRVGELSREGAKLAKLAHLLFGELRLISFHSSTSLITLLSFLRTVYVGSVQSCLFGQLRSISSGSSYSLTTSSCPHAAEYTSIIAFTFALPAFFLLFSFSFHFSFFNYTENENFLVAFHYIFLLKSPPC